MQTDVILARQAVYIINGFITCQQFIATIYIYKIFTKILALLEEIYASLPC